MNSPTRPSPTCRGVTVTGASCQRRAANPSGWCGVCIGIPDRGRAPQPSPPAGAPSDPLGDPHGWVDQLDPAALHRLAASGDLPPEIIRRLAAKDRTLFYVGEVLAQRDDAPPEVLAAVWEHLWDPDDDGPPPVDVGVDLAANPNCPPELFEKLTGPEVVDVDGDADIALAAAANPSCPPAVLARLAEDRWVAEAVAANPACPPETLHDLAADGDEVTAAAVAANPHCPPEILDGLADPDLDDHITSAAAANPACPPAALERLARSPKSGPATLAAVAANTNTPPAARSHAGLLAD